MRQVTKIKAPMETVDMRTGERTPGEATWHILPPPADVCPICALAHPATEPHNAQSMYYQLAFQSLNKRAATWADAAAHCSDAVKQKWRRAFATLGHKWTEPPAGVAPIEHHGLGADKP